MQVTATRKEGYRLLHDGVKTLADVEQNGIRIDMDYCHKANDILDGKMRKLSNKLSSTVLGKTWAKTESSPKYHNDTQLRRVLFDKLGLDSVRETEKGQSATDAASLEKIGLPGIRTLIQYRKCYKLRNTFLASIMRETVDGIMRPSFNMNLVTYRSSSSNPNAQNIPRRDPIMEKWIRQAFVPRPGNLIGEIDYSNQEVRVGACYHEDPVMINYIKDPTKDMHRDMASELYKLPQEAVSKMTRHAAKNKFVFPQFYGDWWKTCAASLWESMDEMDLKRQDDGTPLRLHLQRKGIKRLESRKMIKKKPLDKSSFENHVWRIEDHFWNKRFAVYTEWKEDHFDKYCRRGYFDMLTGFRCSGIMNRKHVINYPVQGAAFHCLLWSMIRLNRWLKKNKMRTMIIGQVHDSMLLDIHPAELQIVLQKARQIMTEDIVKAWPWLIVPLGIEADVSNKNWYAKKAIKIAA